MRLSRQSRGVGVLHCCMRARTTEKCFGVEAASATSTATVSTKNMERTQGFSGRGS